MVYLKLRIGFFIFRTKRKKFRVQKKKKNRRKTAIKFSESARFLPVGRPRSNKHLFIFGLSKNILLEGHKRSTALERSVKRRQRIESALFHAKCWTCSLFKPLYTNVLFHLV